MITANRTRVLPPLFKKSRATGKIQAWEISVLDQVKESSIMTCFGELGGKAQTTIDTIKEGKNLGKINETSHYEQALAEANSKWEKKQKSGYVTSKEAAEAMEISDLIAGGIEPMLAQPFAKHGDKLDYPLFIQPKLDGVRCIAIKDGDEVTLWSRTRKRITSCPHIEAAVLEHFEGDIILDGELYNHSMKSDFEKLISAIRTEKPTELSRLVEYHIYDLVADYNQAERFKALDASFQDKCDFETHPLMRVKTEIAMTSEYIPEVFETFIKQGYEGAMARELHGQYENRRSYFLQKIKEFDDAEFEILGVSEGRGKLQGHAATFICKTKEGGEFEAKMSGSVQVLKDYFENHSLWKGKLLTVQFQGLTGKNKVPRFPVGIRLREGGF